jgi:hypothetical protein
MRLSRRAHSTSPFRTGYAAALERILMQLHFSLRLTANVTNSKLN